MDTPRTDAAKAGETPLTDAAKFPILCRFLQSGTEDVVEAEFAKKLERALRAIRDEAEFSRQERDSLLAQKIVMLTTEVLCDLYAEYVRQANSR